MILLQSVRENGLFFLDLAEQLRAREHEARVCFSSAETHGWQDRVRQEVARCSTLIVWGGYTREQRWAIRYARIFGKSVIYLENGLLPCTVQVSDTGVNARNESLCAPIPDDAPAWDHAQCVALQQKIREREPNPYPWAMAVTRLRQPFVLFPLQVSDDSQIVDNSPYWRSVEDAAVSVARACRVAGLQVVVRPHPCERESELGQTLFNCDELRHTVMYYDTLGASLHDELSRCAAVITINSTMGVEAMAYDKPVIVMGRACYAENDDLTFPVTNDYQLQLAIGLTAKHRLIRHDPAARGRFLAHLERVLVPQSCRAIAERIHQMITERSET